MTNLAKRSTIVATVCATLLIGTSVQADDQALIIANERYQNAKNGASADAVFGTISTLERAGYRVESHRDLTHAGLFRAIEDFNASALPNDRLIYVFSGHMLHNGQTAYLAPVDLKSPHIETINAAAVPVSKILDKAAQHAGGSAVLVGDTRRKRSRFGRRHFGFENAPGLNGGLGPIEAPQGVLFIDSRAGNIVGAIQQQLFVPNRTTYEAVQKLGELVRARGFISRFTTLNPEKIGHEVIIDETHDADFEDYYWQFAVRENTAEAYEDYLRRYPNSRRKNQALESIDRLIFADDTSPAELAEQKMNLTRDQRRSIQQDLTILDFNPRGIDGVFGPGTRKAIGAWQQANGLSPTTFLDKSEVQYLASQAKTARARLAAAAERNAAATRAQDTRYWETTGKGGEEDGLRAYLRKYPEGLYAKEARSELQFIDSQNSRRADGAMLQAWDAAKETDTIAGYQRFIAVYPNSVFAVSAKDRIGEIKRILAFKKVRERAKRQEASYNIPQVAWLLVEKKLAASGHNPGAADGKVTKETRQAIARYQRAGGLPPTGYMDQKTFSRMVN